MVVSPARSTGSATRPSEREARSRRLSPGGELSPGGAVSPKALTTWMP